MQLEEFVAETIKQITAGVVKAQAATGVKGTMFTQTKSTAQSWSTIEFDVALTASQKGEVKGGLTIAGFGFSGNAGDSNSTVSRIKFSLQVQVPGQPEREKGPTVHVL